MKASLSDEAYGLIKDEIITCKLEPGQQIAQSQLVGRYQLGLTPIREALQRLVSEGLVTSFPRSGYVVAGITFSDVYEIYELRSVLEAEAVRLAAVRATDNQLEEISCAADFTYTFGDSRSYSDFLSLNTAFHHSIAVASGNRRLADQIARVLDESTRVFHLGLDLRDSADEMRAEHVALTKALCDRAPDRAAQIVQSQITHSQQRVLQALTKRLEGSSSRVMGNTIEVEPSGASWPK
jgi:DNA-binding GntR family transcriptional regulator